MRVICENRKRRVYQFNHLHVLTLYEAEAGFRKMRLFELEVIRYSKIGVSSLRALRIGPANFKKPELTCFGRERNYAEYRSHRSLVRDIPELSSERKHFFVFR